MDGRDRIEGQEEREEDQRQSFHRERNIPEISRRPIRNRSSSHSNAGTSDLHSAVLAFDLIADAFEFSRRRIRIPAPLH
jgi:hypothetical protein